MPNKSFEIQNSTIHEKKAVLLRTILTSSKPYYSHGLCSKLIQKSCNKFI
jgi:hypothetical protein